MTRPSGHFTTIADRRYYEISAYDEMPPFFMTVVSSSDLWLFLSSTGGVTAGRMAPEKAIFPYVSADQLHRSALHTGARTHLRVTRDGKVREWEPFNPEQQGLYRIERSLLKDELGTRVLFRERNLSLGLSFSCSWSAADAFGIVRSASLEAFDGPASVEIVDGLLNILPSETPRGLQNTSSNLVDAYKWNELDPDSRLCSYSLYARISDRADPAESLSATVAYALGLDQPKVLIAASDFDALRRGQEIPADRVRRGTPGAYLLQSSLSLAAGETRDWDIVLDTGLSQSAVVARRRSLSTPEATRAALHDALSLEHARLRELLAGADAFQSVRVETNATHHVANTLFNVMRGGVFADQYQVERADYAANLKTRNPRVAARHADWVAGLPARLSFDALEREAAERCDPQLTRLTREYLPLVFGRRHGDPSRPWNHFSIRGRDGEGRLLCAYQGNWRDIFQNWEALLHSFPGFAPAIVAKFVNASTLDGYNPYRIDHTGIDWEVEDPEDPWSHIGYWGDHQIVYLLRLLELCQRTAPERLRDLLRRREFCYANVPYRIAGFAETIRDPKHTVSFDHELARSIEESLAAEGSDAKLVRDGAGEVLLVSLLEKLLVPLLAKLGNLVPGGGIWLNTQRPEWNDANNALVGSGLSMVTLYHARRYTRFLLELLAAEEEPVRIGANVAQWLSDTAKVLEQAGQTWVGDDRERWRVFAALGQVSADYRGRVQTRNGIDRGMELPVAGIRHFLEQSLAMLDRSIDCNRRPDSLFHAYNLMRPGEASLRVETLYPMLEGQVAALSSGVLSADETLRLLEALFASGMYRADQHSFMLYPDPPLKGFLEKNRIPADATPRIPALAALLADGGDRIVERDAEGTLRFAAGLINAEELSRELDRTELDEANRQALLALYEEVFCHHSFTGRSGTMFGFEGRGSIYWHMVSKLLLAVQESFFAALEQGETPERIRQIGHYYFRVRAGLSYNKTPEEYGAFPCDPYSHTPGHAGAQQPGMTGQVKEEVITRLGELGIQLRGGRIAFNPALLVREEFNTEARTFRYRDVRGEERELAVGSGELAFTLCQVPILMRLDEAIGSKAAIRVECSEGESLSIEADALPLDLSEQVFGRTGRVARIEVAVSPARLFTLER